MVYNYIFLLLLLLVVAAVVRQTKLLYVCLAACPDHCLRCHVTGGRPVCDRCDALYGFTIDGKCGRMLIVYYAVYLHQLKYKL